MNLCRTCCFLSILAFSFLLQSCKPVYLPQTPPPATSAAQITLFTPLTLTLLQPVLPERYQPVEFAIAGVPLAANPFDERQGHLEVHFAGPGGISVTVGGFWYQAFDPGGEHTLGQGAWRARFTPTTAGQWQASAHHQPSGDSSAPIVFTVAGGESPGFVRVDAAHPGYFAQDNGERFLPIGINMGWWADDAIADYTRWLDSFSANGGNTIRVWMANWSFALEWNDTGVGDYRKRMRQAWLLDELFRIAAARDVKIILVLNHHGQFSQTTNPQWDENPYNSALGGPLRNPEDFAVDPTAIKLFQQRLRYIVDRWGAAPNLLAWEWWNEYNYTPIDEQAMQQWLQTMDSYLASRDPYSHLVTVSGPTRAASPIWQLPGIDFASVHIYTTRDPLQVAMELHDEYLRELPAKPLLLAEFGFATGEEGVDSLDQSGIHLHNGIWASLFSGHAGSGMYWWWDTYVEPLNLWGHFAALRAFLGEHDPAHFTPAEASLVAPHLKAPAAEGLLLQSEDVLLLWVRSKQYTGAAVSEAYDAAVRSALRNRQKLERFVYTPHEVNGHTLVIEAIRAGDIELRWFDPQTGKWGARQRIRAGGETLSVALPPFTTDIAAEIRLLP